MPDQFFLKEILNVGCEWHWSTLRGLQGETLNFSKKIITRPAFSQPLKRSASLSHCWYRFMPSNTEWRVTWLGICGVRESYILHETFALWSQTASLKLLNPNIRINTFQFGVFDFFTYNHLLWVTFSDMLCLLTCTLPIRGHRKVLYFTLDY